MQNIWILCDDYINSNGKMMKNDWNKEMKIKLPNNGYGMINERKPHDNVTLHTYHV